MLQFSNSKYLFVLFFISFMAISANEESIISNFFANINTKSNDSYSLAAFSKITNDSKSNNWKLKFTESIAKLTVKETDTNFNLQSAEALSGTFKNQIVSDFRNVLSKNNSLANNAFNLNSNYTILISNELCNLSGVKFGAVLPNSLINNESTDPTILLSETYEESTIRNVILFLIDSQSKNEKKFADATDEEDDLRLRINILYFDADLVQHDELALSPTTVTTGNTARFRAKGGTFDYYWRLIPSEDSDATISATTGADITYTSGSGESRDFDVLVLMDGLYEVTLNIVVAKARLKNDGSGSKGGGCFLRSKFRD